MEDDLDDLPVIDAHQHFWDLGRNPYPWLQAQEQIAFRYGDYAALKRNYLPADYRRDVGRARIVKTVHVEAEWDRASPLNETRWLEALQRQQGLPSACVAFAALDRDDVAELLAAQAASPLVRGIRCKPEATPSAMAAKRGATGSMDDDRWRRGYALLARHALSFDLQTPWWHLDAAAELARDFPATPLIVNHTGLPADRSAAGLAGWRRAMATIADLPNTAVKISGLGQRDRPWTAAANAPVIRDTIAVFGVERCMFASNFPVDGLVGSFETILAGFRDAIRDLPAADRRKLLHDNAARIYRL